MDVAERWELYRVLAEPARLRVLALVAKEELTIGELAELLGESQPNTSRHAEAITWEQQVYLSWDADSPVVVTR